MPSHKDLYLFQTYPTNVLKHRQIYHHDTNSCFLEVFTNQKCQFQLKFKSYLHEFGLNFIDTNTCSGIHIKFVDIQIL